MITPLAYRARFFAFSRLHGTATVRERMHGSVFRTLLVIMAIVAPSGPVIGLDSHAHLLHFGSSG